MRFFTVWFINTNLKQLDEKFDRLHERLDASDLRQEAIQNLLRNYVTEWGKDRNLKTNNYFIIIYF